ncbi:MAG: transcription antitermination factor NusB [Propionivibrio sp.]|jgi:N utilization substance protein B|uniref:transcription antitermination factor NusB n=1 Tax=Propionivibrio sp. TaxID=2212460 RepID=UPI001B50843A|nr:transcription antitermination factor NusB [Propionivibrio sp.]MBP7201775.1 transcription antitermination factor NusB [Propionivibrio sp.]
MSHVSGKPAKDAKSEKSGGKSPRRRARELALQGLYQWRIGGNDEAAIEAHLADVEGFDKADREFFVGLLRGVLAQQAELQEQLQAFLDRPFAELSPIEASILLAGAFELANYQQTPYRVIINEAIELTKGFGGTDGHKYVNGVLDKLAFKLRPVEVEAKRAERRG